MRDIGLAIEDAGFDAEIISKSKSIEPVSTGTLTGQFRLGGMTCAACVNSVESILRKLPGVKRAVVALATSFGEVEYEPNLINKEEIINAIEDAGFDASFVQSSAQDKIILGISGLSTEMDMQLLEGMLGNMKGVRQFRLDRIHSELEVFFDPEVISSRSIVDNICGRNKDKYKVTVKNSYTSTSSSNMEESANMIRLFRSSLFLSLQ